MEDNKQLYKLMMSAKCNGHLSNARKQTQSYINAEILESSSIDHEGLIKHQLRNRMADMLTNERITKNVLPNGDCEFKMDLMVLPSEVFFDVVNHIVRELTPEQLLKIKS